jgi:natural product precursor
MKKQTKKLTLNKKTISNLTAAEMNKQVGGSTGCYPISQWYCGEKTKKNGNTCPGHNTCF